MPKILILYYSRTGNTENMAKAIAEEAQKIEGIEVELNYHVAPEMLSNFDAIIIGAPTYHHNMTLT